MARPNDSVQVAPDASGVLIATHVPSGESKEYQVTKFAGRAGHLWHSSPTYALEAVVAEAAAAASKVLLAILNPSASTKIVRVQRVYAGVYQAVAAADFLYHFRAFRISAISGGAAATVTEHDTTDPASAVTTAVTAPTSVTASTGVEAWSRRFGSMGQDSAAPTGTNFVDHLLGLQGQEHVVLRAGQGLAIEEATSIAGLDPFCGIEWTELEE